MPLVVIDGLDASGKTTQALGLCEHLRRNGKTVFLRVHPANDSFVGAKARTFLYAKGKSAHFASAFFYMLDVVRSILLYSWRRYDCLLFVRYLMGTAYLPAPLHLISFHFFTLIVPTSDCMFFLDVSPDEALRRIEQKQNRREMFENFEDLKRTRKKALSLALTGRWIIIDANRSVGMVKAEMIKALQCMHAC
ncbi:MAG: thymidylate kinase [Candidatus Bathyarchaeota archaeon]|nr:thymidylate kinase [Candidatus Bathyarchaeota archaeon]